MYTWVSETGRVIEQVRIVHDEVGSRARGRIISADHSDHKAFSLDYNADLDSDRVLQRVRLRTATEDHERSIELLRDGESSWVIIDSDGGRSRVEATGVVDLDVTYSVYFAGVMISRHGLHAQPGNTEHRVLSVDSLTLEVTEDSVTLTSDDEKVHGITATASTSATVDPDGVIIDVDGMSKRT